VIVPILLTLSFIIFLSPYISSALKIPIAPTEIILGMIFANLGFLGAHPLFDTTADIGFYFLMFLAGTGVDLKIFFKTEENLLKNAMIFLALLYILAFACVLFLGLSKIFIVVIPLMSVGILSTLFKEYGHRQNWLNFAMFVGIIGELASIAVLTILDGYIKFGLSSELIVNLAILLGFLGAVALLVKGLQILFWWYPHIKKTLMPHIDRDDKDTRLSMALFCLVIALMMMLNLNVVLGAFIAGTFLPTFFEHKRDLPRKLSSFGFGFLIPIFFAHAGSTISLELIFSGKILFQISLITFSIILVRVLVSLVFLKDLGARNTLLFGLSLSMPLTLLIATATIGLQGDFISSNLYTAMVVAAVLEVIICLILIKFISNLNLAKK